MHDAVVFGDVQGRVEAGTEGKGIEPEVLGPAHERVGANHADGSPWPAVLAEAMTRSRSMGSFSSVARVENITETFVVPPLLGGLIVDGHRGGGNQRPIR